MIDKNIGFIGLGNLGKNLANSILLGNFNLFVHDLVKQKANNLINNGAHWCDDIKSLVDKTTIIITCLPNPKAVSIVMESSDGLIENWLYKARRVVPTPKMYPIIFNIFMGLIKYAFFKKWCDYIL